MQLPAINMEGALWPLVVLVALILIFRAISKGQLKGLTLENGKFSISATQADQRDSIRYHRDRRIAEVDKVLDERARDITAERKKPLKRALKSDSLCSPALSALASDLLFQLYDAVNRNDFKHNLAKNRREEYIAEKVERVRVEYEDFVEENNESPCSDTAKPTRYPAWRDIEPHVDRTIRSWASLIADEVIAACREKLEIYKEYVPAVEENDDKYDLEVLVECIAKNRKYIENLGGEL